MTPEIISMMPANESPYPIARPITYDTIKKKRINPIMISQVLRLFAPIELYIVIDMWFCHSERLECFRNLSENP